MLAQCLAKLQHHPLLLYAGRRLDCCSVPEDSVHPPGSLHTPLSKCQMPQIAHVWCIWLCTCQVRTVSSISACSAVAPSHHPAHHPSFDSTADSIYIGSQFYIDENDPLFAVVQLLWLDGPMLSL